MMWFCWSLAFNTHWKGSQLSAKQLLVLQEQCWTVVGRKELSHKVKLLRPRRRPTGWRDYICHLAQEEPLLVSRRSGTPGDTRKHLETPVTAGETWGTQRHTETPGTLEDRGG